MEFPKTDVGGQNRGAKPARIAGGFTRRNEGRQPMAGPVSGSGSEISAAIKPNRLPIPCPRLSVGHDRPFPVPEHLFGPAGDLFRPGGPYPRGGSPADQAEP